MNPGTNVARRGHPAASRRSHSGAAAPAIPRRVSGPAARPIGSRPAAVPAGPAAVPARPQPGLIASAASLPDHRLLTRLLRGRLWIWCLGLALGGIVTMQVSLLKLNTGISRAVQTSATLEMQNASLQAGIARLSAQERIQKEVTALGMQIPEAGDLEHVRVRDGRDGRRAAERMTAPSDQARERLALAAAAASITSGSSADPAGSTAGAVTGAPVTAVPGAAPAVPATPTPPVTAAAPAPVAPPATPVASAPATVTPQG